jgi:hypothetical protein
MKINLIKTLEGLKPADSEATEMLKGIKLNTVVSCEVKRQRNYEHHKKFFSLLKLVIDNHEKYDNTDDLLFEIKLRLGHCSRIIINDTVCYKPKSISFKSMDQDTFNKFYSKTIDIILKYFLTGTSQDEIENAVLGYS